MGGTARLIGGRVAFRYDKGENYFWSEGEKGYVALDV